MAFHRKTIAVRTSRKNEILDLTERVRETVAESGVRDGHCLIFTPHATAALTLNENADPNVAEDFLKALRKAVPDNDGWMHDRVDENAAAHIKSAMVGASVTVPVENGRLVLGTWQNVFFCEFDGPRSSRQVMVSVLGA